MAAAPRTPNFLFFLIPLHARLLRDERDPALPATSPRNAGPWAVSFLPRLIYDGRWISGLPDEPALGPVPYTHATRDTHCLAGSYLRSFD